MADIQDSRLIYLKGGLFLTLGIFAASLVVVITMSWQVLLLLSICIWSFCRFYYFAFYVIENYVDGGYQFRGLFDFLRYLISHRTESERVE